MQTRMLVGLVAVALLTCSLAVPLSAYAAHDQVKAEKFIEIAQTAYEQALKLRDRAEERGVDVTASDVLIGEGETLLNEAKTSLDEDNFTIAFEKAREAQEKFRAAIAAIPVVAVEAEVEEGQGVLVAIGRAEERIQRLNETVMGINETNENQKYIDWVKGNLTDAENDLVDARAELQEPANVTAAAYLLDQANMNIEKAFKALKLIGDWTVTWRAESFLNGIKNQLDEVRKKLIESAAKGVYVDDLQAKLSDVDQLIQMARSKVLAGEKKGALNDIKDARDILHEISKDLAKRHNGPGEQGKGKP